MHRIGPVVEWDDANVATLKKMWSAGATASIIAAAIPYASRSAVLGKVSRLKLQPRMDRNARAATQGVERTTVARSPGVPSRSTPFRPPAKEKPSRIASSIFGNFTHAKPEPVAMPTEAPDGKGIPLIELRDNSCRWPKGDPAEPGFLFCGDPTANLKDGRPYCPFHSRKATDRAGTMRSERGSQAAEETARVNF